MPACARCCGVYIGVLLAAASYALPGKRRLFLYYPSRGAAALAVVATAPCAADLFLGKWGCALVAGNGARFVASLFAGWGAWVLLAGAATWLRWGLAPKRRLDFGRVAGSLAALLLPGLLVATPAAAAAKLFAAATFAGAINFYALLNYLPLALLLHSRRSGAGIKTIVVCGLVCLAVVEIKWGNAVYEAVANVLS